MDEVKEASHEKLGRFLIISVYFYLSAIEFALIFLFYLVFYQKSSWWDHPTIRGTIILFVLFFSSVIFGYLGRYYCTHPQKAAMLTSCVVKAKLFLLFLVILMLVLISFIVITLKPFVISNTPFYIINNHPVLSYLLVLLALQTMIVLVSLRVKYAEDSLLPILQKNRFHILIWVVMIIYLFIAPDLFTRFILTNGKAIEFSQELPATTDQIKLQVDNLDSIKSDGQELFQLWGWSFLLSDPNQAIYDRFIVLQSDTRIYFFPTQTVERQGVQETFKDLNMDLLFSGYSTIICKDVIKPGRYQIGIVFKNQFDNSTYYIRSNKLLVRTANQLILELNDE
jgi:hypothetical protein